MNEIFNLFTIPLAHWVEAAVDWLVVYTDPLFTAFRWPIAHILDAAQAI